MARSVRAVPESIPAVFGVTMNIFRVYGLASHVVLSAALVGAGVLLPRPATGQTGYYFSTGDNQFIGRHMPLDSEASIAATFDLLQNVYGVDRVYWRGLQTTQITGGLIRPEAALTAYHLEYQSDLMDRERLLNRAAVELAHDRGMEIWGEAALYDWGSLGTDSTNLLGWPGIFESDLRLDNPQWVPTDRFGVRRQSGPIEFGYAEARTAVVDWVDQAVSDAGYDGVIFHTFAENYSTQYADEFGFSDPVVADFAQQYGVDIRRESFDIQALRDLRGQHTTAFLQELHGRMSAGGVDVSVALNGGDADQPMMWLAGGSPFPLAGTMTMDWRQWVDLGIVDELQLGQNYNGADSQAIIDHSSGAGVQVSALAQNPLDPAVAPLKDQGVRAVGAGVTLEELMRNSPLADQPITSLQSADPYLRMKTLGQVIDGDTAATAAEVSPLLNDANILVRRMAVKALGATGDAAAQPLLEQAMLDPDSAISTAAVYALRLSAFNKDQATVDRILAAMVQSGAPPFLEEAMGTLLSMDQNVVAPKVVDAIANHADTDARRLAARTLWNLAGGPNTPQLRQNLTAALDDPDAFVRYYAAATHAFVYPSQDMIDGLLAAAQRDDTVVAMQAATSLGQWFEYGFANVIERRPEVVATLDALFAHFGDDATASNAEWGYEVIGRSLMQAGEEGEASLRQYMIQREDRLLSERAWSILHFPNAKGDFDLRSVEEAQWAYLRRPRWDPVTAMSDGFDLAAPGQTLSSYTPDTGIGWEVLYGEPELQIIQDRVARSGMALELRRPQNTTLSHGVKLTGHVYDAGVSELTQITVTADWLREDDQTFGWMVLDLGHESIVGNPAVIAHTSGTYWVTESGTTLDTGVIVGSEHWETLELVLTWGIAEGDWVEGTYDVFLTRHLGEGLGEIQRLLIASDIGVTATEIGSLQGLILLNDAHPTGDAVTYWDNIDVRVTPVPEPSAGLVLLMGLLARRRTRNDNERDHDDESYGC